ncbi:MAG: Ig-like domain-containing protein, partial [Anaerolineales bacterium]
TLAVLLGAALVFSMAGFAAAKSDGLAIEINEVVNDDFPIVRASLTVADSTGLAIPSLSASDFEVLEDGQAVPARDVQVEINDNNPLDLVLVVDISTRTDSLDSVQLATLALADQMLPDDQFALMQFADVAGVLQGFTGDPDALKVAVTRLEEGGNFSAIYEAVTEAITMAQSIPDRRAAVIVFTNSDNNIGDVAPSAVLEYALDAEAPIYAFGYGARVNQEALGELARMSGGEFYYYDTADGIEADLLDLESRLRIGYNLSFRSQMPPDGLSHELTIRASTGSEAGEAVIQYDALRIPISIGVPAFEADEIEGVVDLAAQVTAGAQIVSVEYRLDGESLGTATSPPYLLTWDSTTAAMGAHVLAIVATDEAGNDATLEIDVTVLPPEPLTVAIVVSEAEVKLGRAVTVQADVEPAAAVGQVDFLVDGMPIASDDAPPYELTLDTADYGIGKHTVSVRVQGSAGQSTDAFEDFEIIPRFSMPDITISRTWIVRVLLILGLIVDVGGALLLFRYLRRMLKKRLVHVYELELAND